MAPNQHSSRRKRTERELLGWLLVMLIAVIILAVVIPVVWLLGASIILCLTWKQWVYGRLRGVLVEGGGYWNAGGKTMHLWCADA